MSEHEIRVLEDRVEELKSDLKYANGLLDEANDQIEQMEKGYHIVWEESRKWA